MVKLKRSFNYFVITANITGTFMKCLLPEYLKDVLKPRDYLEKSVPEDITVLRG